MKNLLSATSRVQETRFIGLAWALIFLVLIAVPISTYASHLVKRPITASGGKINQNYLYGEFFVDDQGITHVHRGVDFSINTGTGVVALDAGTVVAVKESITDNSFPANEWLGNYVVIRSSKTHYDSTQSQNAFVYSIYSHLKKNSVSVSVGNSVTAGQSIAQVNNTGNSDGAHLHLQVNLSTSSTETNPNGSWGRDFSRNPEIWLSEFNHGGTETASIVGRVSHGNGDTAGDKYIHGLNKPSGATINTFVSARTYNDSFINHDDILYENFATTDVSPAQHCIKARDTSASNSNVFKDFGCHNFVAGRTTYVGLYPVYLPDVLNNSSWTTRITIRNNSQNSTAKVTTTYFVNTIGDVHDQREDTIGKRRSISFNAPNNFSGAAMSVGSEDISVIVEQIHNNQKSSYTGIRPHEPGDLNWEVAGETLYLPYVYNSYYGYTSQIKLFNPTDTPTNVTVRYYFTNGSEHKNKSYTLAAYGKSTILPGNANVQNNFYGSMKIESDQGPITAITDAYNSNIDISTQGGIGVTEAYLPYIMKNYYGWDSCFVVRNLSSSNNSVSIDYYWGTSSHFGESKTIGGNDMTTICQSSNSNLPSGGGISAKIKSTNDKEFVLAINQSHVGSGKHMSYNGAGNPTKTVILPRLMKNHNDNGTWASGFRVQNAGNQNATVTIQYYNTSGQLKKTETPSLNPGHSHGIYMPNVSGISNGVYTVRITSNKDIVAVGNSTCTNCGGDNVYAFNGMNR